jgi:hypothetical protein
MDMLVNVLQKEHVVKRVETPGAFFRLLLSGNLSSSHTNIIVYISLLAPLIAMLKLLHPRLPVYYMVRGDEITYVKQANRHFRAFVASIFQKLLKIIDCHFVFVCKDLQVLFEERLGHIKRKSTLPNALGHKIPHIKSIDNKIALVGDFNTVKNVEWPIENLSSGKFEVHLYGNTCLQEEWKRPWLVSHGKVENITHKLKERPALMVLADISAGFPNLLNEALMAGCPVVTHDEFPFKYLPIADQWRFSLESSNDSSDSSKPSELEKVLDRLLREKRDFKRDNAELINLIESDWEQRVWEIFN